ncbi:TPA: DNA uptake porin HofQ [Yersinia enterocolitica]|uniref:DNA uptake porin HofQ n=1 Tax=Yersinia enterocolitica TaxID=630 RepID=A0A7T9XXI1_YEREN|nr:DNA uptake porin HofQ [Yersinia enterocolitica]QQU48892.1 DNA uptake porin HofQ [Yersinia enterocolitica]CFW61209.1 putative outer membrane porin HofQ [Yersinia enterocolitica]CND13424.1 putative outer membrane porin HofQ [Yersinia enterocolitica]CNF26420.1 putative outer membrane porin HofQ [Yersinia enterocolitica]CNG89646.1 putative outer membrane porin HofQ [Yersinia enterocolitica]
MRVSLFKITIIFKIKNWLWAACCMAREPLSTLLLCGVLLTTSFAIDAKSNKPVSLEFQDVPASVVLQALADYQQLNLVIASDIGTNLSLRLVDVPWDQALAIVLRMSHLKVEREGAVMLVFTEQDSEERRLRAEQKTVPESLSNLSLALQYANAEEVADSLNLAEGGLLSPLGSVVVDKRTNTLLIRDTPASLALLKNWLAEMDLPLQQVQLAAHIVTMSRENLQELGVRWGMGYTKPTSSLRMSNFNVNLPLPNSAISAGFNVARIGGRLLELELSALEQENQIDIIASPRLVTSHQQTASIKQGSDIPYTVSQGKKGATTIEFKEAVLGMEVTPKILRNGKITLNLKISQNMPGMAMKRGDSETLLIDKQEIQTQITVNDGETIVLGGIFQQKSSHGLNKVPILADIPWLGGLFKQDARQQSRRELVIFITPRLISA